VRMTVEERDQWECLLAELLVSELVTNAVRFAGHPAHPLRYSERVWVAGPEPALRPAARGIGVTSGVRFSGGREGRMAMGPGCLVHTCECGFAASGGILFRTHLARFGHIEHVPWFYPASFEPVFADRWPTTTTGPEGWTWRGFVIHLKSYFLTKRER
jgi:hypothetical protein